jgi:ubiquinone/menaquinone biosynthesis C-methylase UbiE
MTKYNYKDIASEYDDMVQLYKWNAPDLIFKNLSEVIKHPCKMLDVGCGTGVSSEQFYNLGVELYGLDNSAELIEVCKSKGKFEEVRLFDILNEPIPYPDSMFDSVICSGVLHFFSDLQSIFQKIINVLKPGAKFAFTFKENEINQDSIYCENINGIEMYHHSYNYIQSIAETNNLTLLKEQTFESIKDLKTLEENKFKLIIFKKRTKY